MKTVRRKLEALSWKLLFKVDNLAQWWLDRRNRYYGEKPCHECGTAFDVDKERYHMIGGRYNPETDTHEHEFYCETCTRITSIIRLENACQMALGMTIAEAVDYIKEGGLDSEECGCCQRTEKGSLVMQLMDAFDWSAGRNFRKFWREKRGDLVRK